MSPLTRAMQTAIIGLKPMITNHAHTLFIEPSIREKRNYGGKDSSGVSFGAASLTRLKGTFSTWDNTIDIDSSFIPVKWWQDKAEEPKAVEARILDFISKVRFSDATNVIFVGHSHYFRELTAELIDEVAVGAALHVVDDHANHPGPYNMAELKKMSEAAAVDVLKTHIVTNCALVMASLDFTGGDHQPIKAIELLYGKYK